MEDMRGGMKVEEKERRRRKEASQDNKSRVK